MTTSSSWSTAWTTIGRIISEIIAQHDSISASAPAAFEDDSQITVPNAADDDEWNDHLISSISSQRFLQLDGSTIAAAAAAAASISGGGVDNDNFVAVDWKTPLLLSTLAGLSTCLGAAIVFLFDRPQSTSRNRQRTSATSSSTAGRCTLGPSHMAFALALAGSVMITVSIASILPECFVLSASQRRRYDGAPLYAPITSALFWERSLAFGIGCALYILLSKCAFPEPDAIVLGHKEISTENANGDQCHNENTDQQLHQTLLSRTSSKDDDTLEQQPSAAVTAATARQSHYRKRSVIGGGSAGTALVDSTTPSPMTTSLSKIDSAESLALLLPLSSSSEPKLLASSDSFKIKGDVSRRHSTCCCPSYLARAWRRLRGGNGPLGAEQQEAILGTVPATIPVVPNLLPSVEAQRAWRVAMLLFVSLTVHNFPEGLAVAASSLHSPHLGVTTTVAIALHNIPEGIAICIPCLAARPDAPWLAFALASGSGLAEPLGAMVALLVLQPKPPKKTRKGINKEGKEEDILDDDQDGSFAGYYNATSGHSSSSTSASGYSSFWNKVLHMKNVLAFVAGIMVSVALVELFPEAKRHMKHSVWPGLLGAVLGAAIMLASDAYLESKEEGPSS